MVAPEENTAFNLVHLKTPLPDPRKNVFFAARKITLFLLKSKLFALPA